MPADRDAERAKVVGQVARAIYAKWAEIEGATTTFDQMVELLLSPGYANAKKFHRIAMEEAAAALAVLSAAGFAVVPREATSAVLATGWNAINSGRERRLPWGPGPGLREAWPAMLASCDLARPIPADLDPDDASAGAKP